MDVGVDDQAISQENMHKITSMSREEIEAARQAILEQLGSSHANALKKLKNNFGKSKAKVAKKKSPEVAYDEDEIDYNKAEEDVPNVSTADKMANGAL